MAVASIAAVLLVWVLAGAAVYSPQYVWRVLAWGESDVGDYLDGFPLRPLSAAPEHFRFAEDPQQDAVRSTFPAGTGGRRPRRLPR